MAEAFGGRIAFVCEARSDFDAACRLVERVCGGVNMDRILSQCEYFAGHPYLTWKDIAKAAKQAGVKARRGNFSGALPPQEDAVSARRALQYLDRECPNVGAVTLLRDCDNVPQRAVGLRQARDGFPWTFKVVVGAAMTKLECWILAGFEPETDSETRLLDSVKRHLGFDPREKSEQLTASGDDDKKSAKRVLLELTNGDLNRQVRCLEIDIEVLRRRGDKNGLAEFLWEIGSMLCPVFNT